MGGAAASKDSMPRYCPRQESNIEIAVLLERDSDLRALRELIEGLPSTGGKVVLIRGEAGSGKTALVSAFVDSCAGDVDVYAGACDDLFIAQPLGPFWDIARTEPSLQVPLDDGDRPRLLAAVMALLSRPGRPSVVIIEDTHWADEATLDAIRYLGRRIARTNGLLILTYRDGEVDSDHPLRGVIGDIPAASVVRIHVGGLSMSAVSALVGNSGLDPADVFAVTGGNPFLVTEMATAGGDFPLSLHDSVMARLNKLSPGARELLKTLAVIPEPIPWQDAVRLDEADDARLDEGERRGLLDRNGGMVAFHHELIRRAIESSMTAGERLAAVRAVLDALPEETHPCLLIDLAVEAGDTDRLLDLAPRSARYAAATGSHVQAAEDFRTLEPHLDRLESASARQLLDEWAEEEYLVDHVPDAIRINAVARDRHRDAGDRRAESRALTRAAQYHEGTGQRGRAEELAREAVEVLGAEPAPADLARALEMNAYLKTMAGDIGAVPDLVERTLRLGGEEIDERTLIRSLNHRGNVANYADYPAGRTSLDEARERAEAAGDWYEETRALLNHAWAAVEWLDLPIASDYAQRAIATAARHEIPVLEANAKAQHARVLELTGRWTEASDLARELLDGSAITQMVARPIVGIIEARKGRAPARQSLALAWEMASTAVEIQRLAPAASAAAEYAWISGDALVAVDELKRVMDAALAVGFALSPGRIAYWLWEAGALSAPPKGIAEPYLLLMAGDVAGAAAIWEARGVPYERALALGHGGPAERAEALEVLESLDATATAARLRQVLRRRGLHVPRGRGRETRHNLAGLTARQAEVLQLLDQDLSNADIADRLFLSPRTVENHVSAVLDKLDVATREEAVSRARSAGLLAATD